MCKCVNKNVSTVYSVWRVCQLVPSKWKIDSLCCSFTILSYICITFKIRVIIMKNWTYKPFYIAIDFAETFLESLCGCGNLGITSKWPGCGTPIVWQKAILLVCCGCALSPDTTAIGFRNKFGMHSVYTSDLWGSESPPHDGQRA